MSHRSLTAAVAGLAIAGSLGLAIVPAQAAPTATVHFGDLDLTSATGQRTLARRVGSAVDHVCPADTADRFAQQDCRSTAMSHAHADLRRAGVPTF